MIFYRSEAVTLYSVYARTSIRLTLSLGAI